ncbi:helix-turn-helix domain-containing protein [[Mycobacterium] nativiensis]|uniref:Helix-turn-helix transcriptional regulator n=1 Tax=[Mycobacterium] nativiensis TaxID=2855503 RepID=A0ABU5XWD0_9MYCO|nr:helix-turn-helix transcriptional regulator [Mycolicibacter sp. MYC340]MEB3032296.1 helix-turn-helix transcriptional regulator [Mycolicibacter sp. MYC340]
MTTEETPSWADQLRAHIASAVRAKRDDRGMSLNALADATDGLVTRDTIANLESGRKRVIDVAELILLAKALDVAPVSLLYARTSDVEQSPGVDTSGLDATLWFAGYDPSDSDMMDVYRYADARHWYEEHRNDTDEPTRLNARSTLGQAKRQVRKQGWSVD